MFSPSSKAPTLTSTPNKKLCDDDTGDLLVNKVAAADSGLGTSGIFSETSAQSKKSVCNAFGDGVWYTSLRRRAAV